MKQKLFTVGPVEMYPTTLKVGGEQLPYFRTQEFSDLVLGCERSILSLADAPQDSRAIFLAASGTGAMEAAVINSLTSSDRALIVVGGSFGERFCEICDDAEIPYDAIRLDPGTSLNPAILKSYDLGSYKALLVNAHETSTGVLYDIPRLGEVCRKYGLLFIVDAISAFLCDALSMKSMGIDMLITSSQKALALAPGLSIIVLSARAINIIEQAHVHSHYFGLKKYLLDGTRGQTPFTPAVGVLLQLSDRLRSLEKLGTYALVEQSAARANYFRNLVKDLPYKFFADHPSNALTALSPQNGHSAYDIYEILKDKYGFVVTPNGGKLKDIVFRVGHMGNITYEDLNALAVAIKEIV
ncbi:MAG TPA: aminotransferase class V-fold PLP-dependent enzyme [Rectinema sp.]|nr:MAG: Soluble hydrogenase 42 kDa subunit [Spirochaetes bacterium ADurb.Bin110]HNV35528.1 aminotransferase class V-fold PLP-dependent enzyme [Rectinema sp.]HPW01300.1 aminotransferase class V-fold PLP-dependent enzyme [Rectinema sp.]HQN03049.1 aminotransferase class V-fold PLP-dependent enzyme [Rectinema sp.]